MKGFYMSIDISIAMGMGMMVLMLLLITFSNVSHSDMISLASYKQGESALYTMKHDGTLGLVVELVDVGNESDAESLMMSEMGNYSIPLNALLNIREYDNSMSLVGSFSVQNGPVGRRAYAISLPFKPNSTTGKFAIATLVVGK